jgi:mono/diheme cytochrome c family protein
LSEFDLEVGPEETYTMSKVLKWLGISFGVLIGLVVLVATGLYAIGNRRLGRTYRVEPEAVAIVADSRTLEAGERWTALYCAECHGDDLGGQTAFDEPAVGTLNAPNLTPGQGGLGATYTDADWVRSLRHGVSPGGRPLLIMPSQDYYHLSDADLGAIIAYLKQAPLVDRVWDPPNVSPVGRMLVAAGMLGEAVLPAEIVDHTGARPAAPEPGVTVAYGEYLVRTGSCAACHGQALAGGQLPMPGEPPGTNLTPGGTLGQWSEANFITALRTGRKPNGEMIGEGMLLKYLARLTDDELRAMFLYLQSLPALEDAIK